LWYGIQGVIHHDEATVKGFVTAVCKGAAFGALATLLTELTDNPVLACAITNTVVNIIADAILGIPIDPKHAFDNFLLGALSGLLSEIVLNVLNLYFPGCRLENEPVQPPDPLSNGVIAHAFGHMVVD
jgi:hypothetical protein